MAKKLTFKDIEEQGLLLYSYHRGSKVYGTDTETSDDDFGGVYICPLDRRLGLGGDYQDEVSDEKHDTVWWELGKFMKLILTSNPTVLEALFVPDDKVLYEHPIITEIKKHRDLFLTKACFKPLGGYSTSQIQKAQGQNKKIHWDVTQMTRKTPLDFCFTFDGRQGSENIQKWLDDRGLDQKNCGLVNIPNMPTMYGVYYDFGQHIKLAGITKEWFLDPNNYSDKFVDFVTTLYVPIGDLDEYGYAFIMEDVWDKIKTPIGKHCGIISQDGKSNEIRFSETAKGSRPICFMSYNQNGYESHCRKYKEYEEWKQNRNKARYENNLEGKEKENVDKFYDAKNMCHCFRLIAMATEIANGEGMKLDRRGIDADFLLDIRNRKYTYSELMEKLLVENDKMNDAIKNSTIRDEIDADFVNELLVNARLKFEKEFTRTSDFHTCVC